MFGAEVQQTLQKFNEEGQSTGSQKFAMNGRPYFLLRWHT
jgi:hypothetical protein